MTLYNLYMMTMAGAGAYNADVRRYLGDGPRG